MFLATMEKCLLGSSFLYVFPAKISSLQPILWAPKHLQSGISLLKAANIHFLCTYSSKYWHYHMCTHKLPCDRPCDCWDNTMVLLSLTNFRWSSPVTGSFISTCFRTQYYSHCLWPFKIKISDSFVLLFATWEFPSQGTRGHDLGT